jgi:hypothetical protein
MDESAFLEREVGKSPCNQILDTPWANGYECKRT